MFANNLPQLTGAKYYGGKEIVRAGWHAYVHTCTHIFTCAHVCACRYIHKHIYVDRYVVIYSFSLMHTQKCAGPSANFTFFEITALVSNLEVEKPECRG